MDVIYHQHIVYKAPDDTLRELVVETNGMLDFLPPEGFEIQFKGAQGIWCEAVNFCIWQDDTSTLVVFLSRQPAEYVTATPERAKKEFDEYIAAGWRNVEPGFLKEVEDFIGA